MFFTLLLIALVFVELLRVPCVTMIKVRTPKNPGIFRGLIGISSELDSTLKTHLEKASVFKRTSKTIQYVIREWNKIEKLAKESSDKRGLKWIEHCLKPYMKLIVRGVVGHTGQSGRVREL